MKGMLRNDTSIAITPAGSDSNTSRIKKNLMGLYSKITDNDKTDRNSNGMHNYIYPSSKNEMTSRLNDCKLELFVKGGKSSVPKRTYKTSMSSKYIFENTGFSKSKEDDRSNYEENCKKDKLENMKSGIYKLIDKNIGAGSSPLRERINDRKIFSSSGRENGIINPESKLNELIRKKEVKNKPPVDGNTQRINNMKKILVNTLLKQSEVPKSNKQHDASWNNSLQSTSISSNPLLQFSTSKKGNKSKTEKFSNFSLNEELEEDGFFSSAPKSKNSKGENSVTMRLNFLNADNLLKSTIHITSPKQKNTINFSNFDAPLQASPKHRKLNSISSL